MLYYILLEFVRLEGEIVSDKVIVGARVDPELKQRAEATLNRMGLTMSAGITLFLAQVVNEQSLPFQPSASCQKKAVKYDKK